MRWNKVHHVWIEYSHSIEPVSQVEYFKFVEIDKRSCVHRTLDLTCGANLHVCGERELFIHKRTIHSFIHPSIQHGPWLIWYRNKPRRPQIDLVEVSWGVSTTSYRGLVFMWDGQKGVFMCDNLFLSTAHITSSSTKGARVRIRSICICGWVVSKLSFYMSYTHTYTIHPLKGWK